MIRRVLTVMYAASLLMAAASVGLWLWSYRTVEGVKHWSRDGQHLRYTVDRAYVEYGLVKLQHERDTFASRTDLDKVVARAGNVPSDGSGTLRIHARQWGYYLLKRPPIGPLLLKREAAHERYLTTFGGTKVVVRNGKGEVEQWEAPAKADLYSIVFPAWWITLALLLIPGFTLMVRLLRRPAPPGHCRRCGYDLRASNDRCPECGTPIVKSR